MKTVKIASWDIVLQPDQNKTNVCLPFMVEAPGERLRICFSYGPKEVEDTALSKALLQRAIREQVPKEEQQNVNWESFLPVRNLVTLSLDRGGAYVGCAHRHPPEQEVVISADGSSPGFDSTPIEKGEWRVVLNLHMVAEPVFCKVRVWLEREESIEYRTFELHTHTQHSDGRMGVEQLCQEALAQGLDAIALTDHNTLSGYRDAVEMGPPLPVVRGIEWTTFFGHMLVLNAGEYVDWRFVPRDGLEPSLDALRQTGAAVGIAHPYDLGDPVSTGYRWIFDVRDWSKIDFLEVWSKPMPVTRYANRQTFALWDRLLGEGHRIPATSGRDWHVGGAGQPHCAVTYLGIRGKITGETVVEAIQSGRVFVTAGPYLEVEVRRGGVCYHIGDTLPEGECVLRVRIDPEERRGKWRELPILPLGFRLVSNGSILLEQSALEAELPVTLPAGWARVEFFGRYFDEGTDTLLGFSSPFYIQGSAD